MSKTIKQIADDLGVSKQAVMKCIDNLGLREALTKNGNSFVVGDSQEKDIKTAFSSHQNANQDANQNANQSPTELATTMDVLRSTIDALQGQLASKDEQIKTIQAQLSAKDDQIRSLTEQATVLTNALASAQEAQTRLTESLAAEQALHAGTIQKQLTMHQPEDDKPHGLFGRLFGRKKKAREEQESE